MMQHVVIVAQLDEVNQLIEGGIRSISRHNTYNELQEQ